ncbi:interferon-induced very large GTPase 1-like [Artemia franciscana]|uniref:interferon-induced very large GTPase 1-like n=1 Tax=Artemia franciscana TaxID=6661 RepID=UPI0032DBA3FB
MTGLENYRSKILILQESFAKEGELREKLKKIELITKADSEVIAEEIKHEEQFRFKNNNRNDPLINYFLQGFEKNNIDQIILHLRVIEDAISVNIKKSGIDAQLENLLKQKQYNYLRSSQSSSRGPEFCSQIESKWKEYESAKQKRNYALLSLRHLWREVSLYYSAGQCGDLENLPHLAAACLIAGETLELYDGDANMLNVDWIGAIFKNLSSLLPSKRFFVLSVLGEQSSGKSTLLNTMFGIRLATSVGQCTKGLTVTLVKTVNRKEYDYVVILDTEGVRSPEMTGIHGCTKRDNKIAALSILQSDAVILTINGEQNNALKAILPIVALAYKGSKLAEQRGGLLSCKIFAAYNKVEINEGTRNRLLNNFTQLSDTLVQSLATVNSHQDSNFHTSISFPPMFLNDGDIRVFGCNKNGNPPSDVPNEDFSMEIIDFREYIHEQVVNQTGWISRNIEEIYEYLLLVLECLNTSNFDLSFETVCDRYVYSGIEKEYLNLRKSYIITFEEQFELLKDKYKKENSSEISDQNTLLSKAVDDLKLVMRTHTKKFKEQVEKIFKNEKNQKFEINYRSKVKDTISRQTSQWCDGLQLFLRNLLFFDKKVEEYEKEMTDKIKKVFRDRSLQAIPKAKLIEEFDSYFNEIVQKAQKENPPMDINDAVLKAYKNNPTIESLELDLLSDKGNNTGQNGQSLYQFTKKTFKWTSQSESNQKKMEKAVIPIIYSITTRRKCYSELVVYDVISEVENFLKHQDRKIDRETRKKVHKFAYDSLLKIFEKIQGKWEQENSVYKRFLLMKDAMRGFFLDIASGLSDVDLKASRVADFFSRHSAKAFEKEVQEMVMSNLRKKNWPKYAKTIQGHMDLYLIEIVESEGISEVLYHITNPSMLKRLTTNRLIKFDVDIVLEDYPMIKFNNQLETCLRNAYESNKKTGSNFYRNLFGLLRMFQTTYITDSLRKEMSTFGWNELDESPVNFELRHVEDIVKASSLSSLDLNMDHVIDNVSAQLETNIHFEAAFCKACEEECPLCKSPCFLEEFHKSPHDTFHQPDGLVGWRYLETKKLSDRACNTAPLQSCFVLNHGESNEERWRYADFSKKFPNWMQPDIGTPVSDYREYLIRRYNKEIAVHYGVNPSDTLYPYLSGDTERIANKIKRKVDFLKDFGNKTLSQKKVSQKSLIESIRLLRSFNTNLKKIFNIKN